MLKAVAEAGQLERAVQMLNDVWLESDRGPDGASLEVVVRAHLARGQLDDALDVTHTFKARASSAAYLELVSSPA
jgi:hypothetical protein